MLGSQGFECPSGLGQPRPYRSCLCQVGLDSFSSPRSGDYFSRASSARLDPIPNLGSGEEAPCRTAGHSPCQALTNVLQDGLDLARTATLTSRRQDVLQLHQEPLEVVHELAQCRVRLSSEGICVAMAPKSAGLSHQRVSHPLKAVAAKLWCVCVACQDFLVSLLFLTQPSLVLFTCTVLSDGARLPGDNGGAGERHQVCFGGVDGTHHGAPHFFSPPLQTLGLHSRCRHSGEGLLHGPLDAAGFLFNAIFANGVGRNGAFFPESVQGEVQKSFKGRQIPRQVRDQGGSRDGRQWRGRREGEREADLKLSRGVQKSGHHGLHRVDVGNQGLPGVFSEASPVPVGDPLGDAFLCEGKHFHGLVVAPGQARFAFEDHGLSLERSGIRSWIWLGVSLVFGCRHEGAGYGGEETLGEEAFHPRDPSHSFKLLDAAVHEFCFDCPKPGLKSLVLALGSQRSPGLVSQVALSLSNRREPRLELTLALRQLALPVLEFLRGSACIAEFELEGLHVLR
mmetsp:Transcript_8570/g.24433  ORF Transcript_8570/g.24433 Transcript_8570/m.24433 type:complete len:510 (-) Transcript_8570:752-2281(-)